MLKVYLQSVKKLKYGLRKNSKFENFLSKDFESDLMTFERISKVEASTNMFTEHGYFANSFTLFHYIFQCTNCIKDSH